MIPARADTFGLDHDSHGRAFPLLGQLLRLLRLLPPARVPASRRPLDAGQPLHQRLPLLATLLPQQVKALVVRLRSVWRTAAGRYTGWGKRSRWWSSQAWQPPFLSHFLLVYLFDLGSRREAPLLEAGMHRIPLA